MRHTWQKMSVQGPSCGMHFMLSGALQRFAQQILVFAVTRPRRPFPSLLSLSVFQCTCARPDRRRRKDSLSSVSVHWCALAAIVLSSFRFGLDRSLSEEPLCAQRLPAMPGAAGGAKTVCKR